MRLAHDRSVPRIRISQLVRDGEPCRFPPVHSTLLQRLALVFSSVCALSLGGCGFFMSHRAPQDAILDPTPRLATTQVEVLRDEPNRRYKVIAGLNAYYDTKDGGAPVEKLVKRAKSLGAHAIILAPPQRTWRVSTSTTSGDECPEPSPPLDTPVPNTLRSGTVFSARAIVYE